MKKTDSKKDLVLVTWVSVNSDPYQWERNHESYVKDRVTGEPIPGPTLDLLFSESSEYRNRFSDIVILHRDPIPDERESSSVDSLFETLDRIRSEIEAGDRPGREFVIHRQTCSFDNPNDFDQIFAALEPVLPKIHERFPNRQLVFHASPGTPQQQAITTLMFKSGFGGDPVRIIQTIPPTHRGNGPCAKEASFEIDSIFKRYSASKPRQARGDDPRPKVDPSVFRSEKMRKAYGDALRYARISAPILITGERGVGKTTLAEWIRANGPWCKPELDASWPSLVCGQYTPETMRSELFGHVKNAFTGADTDKTGLLKIADGDTVFLDEIGDMSPELQRLLIRAVEDGSFHPIGSNETIRSKFRLVTATNIDEQELRKRVDADFLDRVGQKVVHIPPLREVVEDHEVLWRRIFDETCRDENASDLVLSEDSHRKVLDALSRSSLDGNLRDLQDIASEIVSYHLADESWDESGAVDAALAKHRDDEKRRRGDASPLAWICRLIAEGRSLEGHISADEPLDVNDLVGGLRLHLAKGLLAMNRTARFDDDAMKRHAGITVRQLRTWAKDES